MTENQNSTSESLQNSAQTTNAIRGAVKTGKAIASTAKGAAIGGLLGAAFGFAQENRKLIFIIIITAIAFFMIPVLIICMLPCAIFNGLKDTFLPDEQDIPVLNDSSAITNNLYVISSSIEKIMTESMDNILSDIDFDFQNTEASYKEIVNPYENGTDYSVISYVSQYSASKNKDYQSISISDMIDTLRNHEDKLYSYTRTVEIRKRVVRNETVNSETGEKIIKETEIMEKWAIYTVTYNGEEYLADHVFMLSEEQKELARNYVENLKLFLEDSKFE